MQYNTLKNSYSGMSYYTHENNPATKINVRFAEVYLAKFKLYISFG